MIHSLPRWPALRAAALMSGLALASCLAVAAPPAATPAVVVADAWIRATVPGQSGTGGFMKLTAQHESLELLGFSSSVAGTAELHEMAMEGDVMRMRPVNALPLPKGRAVALKPGGHHLMLMGLNTPLKAGSQVPIRLIYKDAKGKTLEQAVNVPVLAAAPAGASAGKAEPASGHEHHHHHHHDH